MVVIIDLELLIDTSSVGYKDWTKEITVQSGSEVQLTTNLEKIGEP